MLKKEVHTKKATKILESLNGEFDREKELMEMLNSPEMLKRLNEKDDETEKDFELYDKFEGAHRKREVKLYGERILAKHPDDIDVLMKIIDYEFPTKRLEKYLELKEKYFPKFMKDNDLDESFNVPEEDHLYARLDNRPFFRLLFEIAYLELTDRNFEKAFEDFLFILKLNPNDNQGAREEVAMLAYNLDKKEVVDSLYEEYNFDHAVQFIKACFSFQKDRNLKKFNERLMKINKYLCFLMNGELSLDHNMIYELAMYPYSSGSLEEGCKLIYYFMLCMDEHKFKELHDMIFALSTSPILADYVIENKISELIFYLDNATTGKDGYPKDITFRKVVNDIIKKPVTVFNQLGNIDEKTLKDRLEFLVKDGMLKKNGENTYFPDISLRVIAYSFNDIIDSAYGNQDDEENIVA